METKAITQPSKGRSQMGKMTRHILGAILIFAMLGCTTASKEIRLKSRCEREDVFSETARSIPTGMAELRIRVSVKTRLERQFVSGRSRGIPAPGYPFLINIDGQAATWRVGGQRDSDANTETERGEGLRYILQRNLTLSAGSHKIFFGLPEEDYFVHIEAALKDGEVHLLEFRPLYGECLTGHRSFRHGVCGLEIFLNGNPVSPQTNG